MTEIIALHPVSYHLRDFGQYQHVDLDASTQGNLTLLGENAVGKTTLANAFFPVLIDGSISTPSFNPARGTETVAGSDKPRNSPRDQRTFNSMLLGWGKGAQVVRTGYTYMCMQSSSRQVVLGIGAHRQADGRKSATWWFVLEQSDANAPLDLVCTDANGRGLDRAAFETANMQYGAELMVFSTSDAYRSYVAEHVYGFDSGRTLGKLAAAYRLLASPILTGGSARFAPIPNALREAQEPIDTEQIIRPLAESRRELNTMLAMANRLRSGQRRLAKVREDLFWGNLNQLSGGPLKDYIKQVSIRDQAVRKQKAAEDYVTDYTEQLLMLDQQRLDYEDQLAVLRDRLAEQKVMKEQRETLMARIRDLVRRIEANDQQQAQLTKLKVAATELATQVTTQAAAIAQLEREKLGPKRAELSAQSTVLPGLTDVLVVSPLADMLTALRHYIQAGRQQASEYRHLETLIGQTSADVLLVQEMQTDMGTAIESRTHGRTQTGLLEDNTRIHAAGAAQMNTNVATLQEQQAALTKQHPDLTRLLAAPDRLDQLESLRKTLQELRQQLADAQRQLAIIEHDAAQNTERMQALTAMIDLDFDRATATELVTTLTAQRDALKIDPDLPDQVAELTGNLNATVKTITEYQAERAKQEGIAQAQGEQCAAAEAELLTLSERLNASLAVLKDFTPADEDELPDIDALQRYAADHRKRIATSPARDMPGKIRDQLDGNERKGYDRDLELATLFEERGRMDIASAMHQARTVQAADLIVTPFDVNAALAALQEDEVGVAKAVAELQTGNDVAMQTYMNAATISISQQYSVIDEYNAMLTAGQEADGIRLQVELVPVAGNAGQAVAEARDINLTKRPMLAKVVQDKIEQLIGDSELATDEKAFQQRAEELLDTRRWSNFRIFIYRRHSDVAELVDDTFVQSGGSGAEKAQAMVLPLLLVPKMRLARASKKDAPHLVMFDEFADKLDPETARAFARTIARFGFNFIATMPSGAQSKIMADGVANRAYEVRSTGRHDDGFFHPNQVHEIMHWRKVQSAANE